MTSQEFAVVDVLRLQIQEGWPDLPNQILNPSGEGGAWGWSTINPFCSLSSNGERLRFRVTDDLSGSGGVQVGCQWRINIARVTAAGQQVRALVNMDWINGDPSAGEWRIGFGAEGLGLLGEVVFPDPLVLGDNELPPTDIPIDTEIVMLQYWTPADPTIEHEVRFKNAWLVCGDAADVAASDPLTDPPWVDILGSAAKIDVERDELNVGLLTATLYDSTLDPGATDLIRPGKRCRLDVLVEDVWESLFTGKLDNPSSAYEIKDPRRSDLRRVRIELHASDAVADLANDPRPEGVSTMAELPYVLLGTGVPFNVNGSDDAIDPATVIVVAVNDQASALDQVAITRDTALGYVWLDRHGVLQAWDRDALTTAVVLAVDESSYSDANIDFDVDRTFNTLTIELLRVNPGTGETETIAFGPYVDEAARREWRARTATFKVQGILETDIPAYAAGILELNARPVKRINSVSLPVRTLDELETYALLELYDLLSLSNAIVDPPIVDQQSRITTLKHRIVIKKEGARLVNRWWVDLEFSTDGNVAPPTVSPAPTPGGGGARTLAELLRPIGEVTMWYGPFADIPAGWLPCNGGVYDPDTYPLLEAVLVATGLASGVLPNFEDRFPIGAGTKALGTSGASALAGATAGDWRAVWFIIRAA